MREKSIRQIREQANRIRARIQTELEGDKHIGQARRSELSRRLNITDNAAYKYGENTEKARRKVFDAKRAAGKSYTTAQRAADNTKFSREEYMGRSRSRILAQGNVNG